MNKEIFIRPEIEKEKKYEELFSDLSLDIKYICLCPFLLKFFKQNHFQVAAQIGYPFGILSIRSKLNEIDYAISNGVKTVDFYANSYYIINSQYSRMIKEISEANEFCKQKNTTFRLVVDYQVVKPRFFEKISELSLTEIICSSGIFGEEFSDALIFAHKISNLGFYPILAGVCTNEQYNLVNKNFVYGIRYFSVKSAKQS